MLAVPGSLTQQRSFSVCGKTFHVVPKSALPDGNARNKRVGALKLGGEMCFIIEVAEEGLQQKPLSCLTGREMQVANLIAQGKCDKVVARELGISENTVSEHLRRIFHKLGIGKRTALVALFVSGFR